MAFIYILENQDAQRIKIGATHNHPNDRLLDINRMWQAVKGRCQICLSWRMLVNGRMPKHVLSMNHCAGSGEPPLEYSTKLAEKQTIDLQGQLPWLSGSDLRSASKRIKNLKKILQTYKENPIRIGGWQLRASFPIDSAYQIEELVHKALAVHLDKEAPFGEVFSCSAEEAISTIEETISQMKYKSTGL
ncbi:hypothetical protein [Polynucleobacter sp. MWH-UH23A]|uniref:hypothetical protein n=1 Tax=Polynucleobacter sp. MWH-UH23A TaxID=1855613 RepID=UPI003364EA1B